MAKSPNTTTAPTGQIAPFGLRMLPELREQVEAAAKASGRSMNAEIVARLSASFSSVQGSVVGRDIVHQPMPVEHATLTPVQLMLVKEAATEAAKQVVEFQAQSLQPVHFGGGSVVLGPPPEQQAKQPKKPKP